MYGVQLNDYRELAARNTLIATTDRVVAQTTQSHSEFIMGLIIVVYLIFFCPPVPLEQIQMYNQKVSFRIIHFGFLT
jgi:hypothetical protein